MPDSIVSVVSTTALAYLLGSLSFSYWVVRLARGVDLRTLGSHSAGATNVLRIAGRGPALLALALDVLKGVAAVATTRAIGSSTAAVGLAAVAVVVGHIFPIFSGFRGGKGVATAAGALSVLSITALVVVLAVFAVVVATTRYVSLGSMVSAIAFPCTLMLLDYLGYWQIEGGGAVLAAATAIAALILFKHRLNLGRLWDGSENKLGERVEK